MATILAPTHNNVPPNGTFGNLSQQHLFVELNGAAIGDEVELGMIPAGTNMTALKAIHENLGAGTTVDIGYRYVDEDNGAADPDFFVAAGSTAAAGTQSYSGKPQLFQYDAVLTLTVGGAAATGRVDVLPEYIFTGI